MIPEFILDIVESITAPINSILFLTLLTALLAVLSNIITRKIVDYEKMREYQELVKQLASLKMEAAKKKSKRITYKIRKIERRVNDLKPVIMRDQLKQGAVFIAIFWPVFIILKSIYTEVPVASLPFDVWWIFKLPIISSFRRGSVLATNVIGFLGYYALSYSVFNSFLNKMLSPGEGHGKKKNY